MKTFKEFLTEARMAPLYHATPIFRLEEIFKSNMLNGVTGQNIRNDVRIKGVSLTRRLEFAKNWNSIIFELDQLKLTNNHKIIPVDYFSLGTDRTDGTRRSEKHETAEAEEFVVGSIKNLSQYVKRMYARNNPNFISLDWELINNVATTWKVPLIKYDRKK